MGVAALSCIFAYTPWRSAVLALCGMLAFLPCVGSLWVRARVTDDVCWSLHVAKYTTPHPHFAQNCMSSSISLAVAAMSCLMSVLSVCQHCCRMHCIRLHYRVSVGRHCTVCLCWGQSHNASCTRVRCDWAKQVNSCRTSRACPWPASIVGTLCVLGSPAALIQSLPCPGLCVLLVLG